MARDFTLASTANYLSFGNHALGPVLNGSAIVSVHAWTRWDAFNAGANDNRVLSISMVGVTGLMLGFDGAASNRVRLGGRSVSTDAFQAVDGTTNNTTGTWYSAGGVFNYTGDSIRVYRNGTQEASTAVTFGNSSYTDSAHASAHDCIMVNAAPPSVVGHLQDGQAAEIAMWLGDITTAGFEALADGYSPLFVRPDLLALYVPLIGRYSPEIELFSNKNATINGTINNYDHPRIIYPSNINNRRFTTAVVGGTSVKDLIQMGILSFAR